MRREQSTRPEGSSSISEGGRPLKMSKRRLDTTQAAAKPATPAAPLDSEPAKMAGKDSDVSRPRSSIHRPSSTASFWSVQSAAGPAATAARDPEHSTLVAAAAADLEVDVRRSRKRRRIHEVPASPAEEPPEVSTANSGLPVAVTPLPDANGKKLEAGGAPTISDGAAQNARAATTGQWPAGGIILAQVDRERRLAAAKAAWQKLRSRMTDSDSAARKRNSLETFEALVALGGPEADQWSPSEGTDEVPDALLSQAPDSAHSLGPARRLSFTSKVTSSGSGRPERRKTARVCPSQWLCGVVAVLLLAIVLVLAALWTAKPDVVDADPRVCASTDCADHGAALGVGWYDVHGHDTRHPCQDFGKFVCSVAPIRYPWTTLPLMTQLLIEYVTQFGRQLSTVAVLAKAGLATRTCLDSSTRSDDDVKRLLEFMKGRSFDWPTDEGNLGDPSDYQRPLKVSISPQNDVSPVLHAAAS